MCLRERLLLVVLWLYVFGGRNMKGNVMIAVVWRRDYDNSVIIICVWGKCYDCSNLKNNNRIWIVQDNVGL